FFFSSRRRHTRFSRDWSSDVCSSDLGADAKTSVLPTYPILAGQHADFLEHALNAYKRGAAGAPASANIRNNAVMGAMAAPLSLKIGRASCRGRVESADGAASSLMAWG